MKSRRAAVSATAPAAGPATASAAGPVNEPIGALEVAARSVAAQVPLAVADAAAALA